MGRISMALAMATVIALAGCHRKEVPAPTPRPVVAIAVQPDLRPVRASLPGEVQARYATPLSFRIAGKIIERHVHLGDTVKAGQITARLDPSDGQKNTASAQAQRDAAQHRLVYAKQQLERDTAQARENLIAPAQLEQTQNAYASALAQRDQAQQQLALAQNQLRYATLTANHAGVITAENAETGQNVAAGQAVYQLAWSGDIDIVCDVPENALAALTPGQITTVTLPALPAERFTARVREVAPAAGAQSRTYRTKLTLEAPSSNVRLGMSADIAFNSAANAARNTNVANANVANANLANGTHRTNGTNNTNGTNGANNANSANSANDPHTPRATKNAAHSAHPFTLPVTALFHDGAQPAVWVVRVVPLSGNARDTAAKPQTGTLELRRVQIAHYGERTVSVSAGLNTGDYVVLQGAHTVSAGEKVHIVAPLYPEDFVS
jgi:multidrug efflux system membrane fusion protein